MSFTCKKKVTKIEKTMNKLNDHFENQTNFDKQEKKEIIHNVQVKNPSLKVTTLHFDRVFPMQRYPLMFRYPFKICFCSHLSSLWDERSH